MSRISERLLAIFCASISICMLFSACEIGLGAQVDTDSPVLSITYPPDNSVIRSNFILYGTCSDDKGLQSVTVKVTKTVDGQTVQVGDIQTATIDAKGGTWQLTVNTPSATGYTNSEPTLPTYTYPLADGTYVANVYATDTSGRTSGVSSRSFSVDNTAPVLLLNKPLAAGDETATSYGRTLKLAGDVSDDHTVTLSMYIKKCTGYGTASAALGDTISVTDLSVSSMSSDTPLIVAKYYGTTDDDSEAALQAKYNAIYGTVNSGEASDTLNETRYYYSGLVLCDSAKVYQNPTEESNMTSGNSTDMYYLNTDDLSGVLDDYGTDGLKSVNIKSILNGTDTTYTAAWTTIKDALQKKGNFIKCTGADDVTSDSNVFKLDPDSYPTWAIGGYALGTNNGNANPKTGFRSYTLGGNFTLTINPNSDNDYVAPSKISLMYKRLNYDESNDVDKWSESADDWYYAIDASATNKNSEGNIAPAWTNESDKSSVSKQFTISGLSPNTYYAFKLSGEDRAGNSYVAENNNDTDYAGYDYGYMVASSGQPPEVDFTTETKQYVRASQIGESGGVSFSGTIIEETGNLLEATGSQKPFVCSCSVYSGIGTSGTKLSSIVPTLTVTGPTASTPTTFTWTVTVTGVKDTGYPSAAGNYTYDFLLYATNAQGNQSPLRHFYMYADNQSPVLTVTNTDLSDNAKIYETSPYYSKSGSTSYYTLHGTWSDASGAGTGTLYYSTKAGAAVGDSIGTDASAGWVAVSSTNAPSVTTTASWSNEIAITEGSGKSLRFYAVDTCGNATEVTSYSNLQFDFSVPTLTMGTLASSYNANSSALTSGQYILTGTYSDNNASAAPTVAVTATLNGTAIASGAADGNGKSYDYSYSASSGTVKIAINKNSTANNNGTWVFSVVATDAAGRTTTAGGLTTVVDTVAPVAINTTTYPVKINKAVWTDGTWYNSTSLPISGFYDEETSGMDTVYCWINESGTKSITNAKGSVSINGKTAANAFGITLSDFAVGTNTLCVAASDAAGNLSTFSTYTVKVDEESPSVVKSDITGEKLTNGKADVVVTGTCSDDSSGVAKVELYVGTTLVATTTSISANAWSATIPQANLADNTTVYGKVYDAAGNSSKSSLFTLSVDTEVPSFTITSPDKDTKLNGVKTINGTVSDNKTPAALDLYYYVGSTAPNVLSDWTHYSSQITDLAKIYNFSFADFDFTTKSNAVSASGGIAYIWLLPVAYDKAGNCSIDVTGTTSTSTLLATNQAVKYTVDQNSDRPIIKLTNLKSSGGTLTSNTVYGMVSDDDGTIASANFKMSEDNSTWYDAVDNPTVVSYTGGSWTFTLPSVKTQGERTLYFKVTDTANKTFTYDAASDFEKPYVRGTAYTASPLTDEATFVTYTLDTNPPTISSIKILMNGDTEPQTLVNNMKFGKKQSGL